MPKSRTVYPVANRYLTDVPHVAHECDDPRCVESGAFSTEPPAEADQPEAKASEQEE